MLWREAVALLCLDDADVFGRCYGGKQLNCWCVRVMLLCSGDTVVGSSCTAVCSGDAVAGSSCTAVCS